MSQTKLWDAIPALMDTHEPGQDIFLPWLDVARADFATRGEQLETYVSSEQQEKMFKELTRAKKRFETALPSSAKRNTRAIWMGLFEEARARGYTLTTYISISAQMSENDEEWAANADVQKWSYAPLTALTKAHQKPKECPPETATALYIFLPVAFLASVIFHAAPQKKLAKIEEYGFGWDSGDFANWRPRKI